MYLINLKRKINSKSSSCDFYISDQFPVEKQYFSVRLSSQVQRSEHPPCIASHIYFQPLKSIGRN